MKKKLLVINYHKLLARGEDSEPGDGHVYDIRLEDFEEQLRLIGQKKYNLVSLLHAGKEMVEDKLNIALSFDDGCESDWKIAFPKLSEKGFPASFFIVPGRPVDWYKIKELHRHGFTIGSHGLTHTSLTKLTPEKCADELMQSARIISDQLSAPTELFAFPFGQYNNTCVRLVKAAGYRHGFTTRFMLNQDPERFLIHRWSVKKYITPQRFEKILGEHFLEHFLRKMHSAGFHTTTRMIGHGFMNKLHAQIMQR